MLVDIPKNIPIHNPRSHSPILEGLCYAAESYLDCGTKTATVIQSNGKFHLVSVETHKRSYSEIALSMFKILSYATVIFPLIAYMIKTAGRIHKHYCYHPINAESKNSLFVKAFKENRLEDIKHLYALDNTVINMKIAHPKYGNISPFMAACLEEKLPILEWLLSIHGNAVLTWDHEGNVPLVLACKENKQETVQWLLNHGCNPATTVDAEGQELFFLASKNESPDIAFVLLQHNRGLLEKRNDAGLTPFEAALAALPQTKTTTPTLQWLYNQGSGRGLFITACKNGLLDQAKKLYGAIGEPILHEVNEKGMNHFERACYDGNLKLVTTFFDAAHGNVHNIYINPHTCKGGVLRFIHSNHIV